MKRLIFLSLLTLFLVSCTSKIKNNGRTLKEICAEHGIEIKDEWLKKKDPQTEQ